MNTNLQIDPKLNKQVRAWYYFGKGDMLNFETVLTCMSAPQLLAMWLGAEDTIDVDAADRARATIDQVGIHLYGTDWLTIAMKAANGFNIYQAARTGMAYTSQTSR